jgi:hypothetical protein
VPAHVCRSARCAVEWHRGGSEIPKFLRGRLCYDGGLLELAFSTRALRTLCENEAAATRELGAKRASSLRRRLADLRAAISVKDLVAGHPTQTADSKDNLEIDIGAGARLVFCANHSVVPRLTPGNVDWSNVSRVKLLRIESDNGY